MRGLAFSTADPSGRTLKSVLEDRDAVKVFLRHPQRLRCAVQPLRRPRARHRGRPTHGACYQKLFEAPRQWARQVYREQPGIGYQQRRDWSTVKDHGQRLFRLGKDGYAVFNRRPLPAEVLEYSVQDVTFLPKLRDSYRAKLCNASWLKVQEETVARIALSQSSSYNGKGRHMALGPPGWQNWHPSFAEQRERSLLQEDEPSGEEVPAAPTAPTAATADTGGRAGDVSVIAEALSNTTDRRASPEIDGDDDSDGHDMDDSGGYRSYTSSREQSPRDYTACDIECGYCGHCRY